jgi:hypothetical protein
MGRLYFLMRRAQKVISSEHAIVFLPFHSTYDQTSPDYRLFLEKKANCQPVLLTPAENS